MNNSKLHENFSGTFIKLKDGLVWFQGPLRIDGDKALFLVCQSSNSVDDYSLEYPEPLENYLSRFELAWKNHTGKGIIFDNTDLEVIWRQCLDKSREEFLESRNNLK